MMSGGHWRLIGGAPEDDCEVDARRPGRSSAIGGQEPVDTNPHQSFRAMRNSRIGLLVVLQNGVSPIVVTAVAVAGDARIMAVRGGRKDCSSGLCVRCSAAGAG